MIESLGDKNAATRPFCGSEGAAADALDHENPQVIPEGAGPVNPLFLSLIFSFAVLRLFVGASR
jgi:hypothetical protein